MKKPPNRWKQTTMWVLPLAIGLIGFSLGWWISGTGRHDQSTSTVAVTAEAVSEAGSSAQQMYTCAMHPQVRSPNPDDQCPICGMDLIPVPLDDAEEDEGDLPRLRLSPRAAALMQIAVHPVAVRPVTIPVRLYGRIGYDETRLRTISAWMAGRLERLYVDFTGTAVRKGQPMVEIYSPALITAQEEHLQAIVTAHELEKSGIASLRDTTRMTVDASHDRLRLLGLDAKQINRLEKQGHVDERLIIPAPLSGVVIERLAAAGDYVQTGQPIYRLADLSHLWVALEVYESDIQWLKVGQQTIFSTQSHPGERFTGKVAFIDPILNEATRTLGVRVDLPNPDGRLKPGMLVRGVIEADVGPRPALSQPDDPHAGHGGRPDQAEEKPVDQDSGLPLVIPATAPLITGERAVVYVQLPGVEHPTFEPRDILLGPRAGAWYVVRDGLAAGELVVVNGAFKIDSELQIRGRPSMMQPEGGPPPIHDHGDQGAPAPPLAAARPDPDRPGPPRPFQAQVGRLVLASFELVQALSTDNAQAAQQAARRIDEALHAIAPTLLTNNTHRQQWNRLSKTLHDTILSVATEADLADQRRHFRSFSDALIEMVHAFGVAETGPVYRAMCPMFEGGESFWLQPQAAITNPYFGAMMFTCGEIQETIVEADDPHRGH